MFEIQLKFYNNVWRNYFNKQFDEKNAIFFFKQLISEFPYSQWRLIYKPFKKE